MTKIDIFFLGMATIFGFWLRVLYLPSGALTFSYDQGRDAYIAKSLIEGDIKIQGPPASTPGLFHGVFYYYLIAPFYLIGQGNPVYPAVAQAFINTLGIRK